MNHIKEENIFQALTSLVRRCNPDYPISACPPDYLEQKDEEEVAEDEREVAEDGKKVAEDEKELSRKDIAEYCSSYTAVIYSSKR